MRAVRAGGAVVRRRPGVALVALGVLVLALPLATDLFYAIPWPLRKAAGWIGELHPRWMRKYELPQSPILFELDAEPLLRIPAPDPRVPSRFPPVVRDIALEFDSETPVQAVLDAIEAEKPAIVQAVRLFSLYRGAGLPAGKKSLAFRVVMQHTERTLTDAEADAARDALVALLGRRFSARLRT